MSFISLNKSVWKFPCFRLWQATELPNKVSLFFFPPRDAAMFLYFRLTSMSVSDEKFLSSHSSLIYLTLSSPLPHTHTHTHRWSRPVEDLPSEEAAGVSAQMFLSAKGAPSLEHQRGEIVTHSRGKYLRQRDEPLAGDSSLANVTPRNEEVAKKNKKTTELQIFFLWP